MGLAVNGGVRSWVVGVTSPAVVQFHVGAQRPNSAQSNAIKPLSLPSSLANSAIAAIPSTQTIGTETPFQFIHLGGHLSHLYVADAPLMQRTASPQLPCAVH